MYSLYHSLLAQHPRQLTPIRCSVSTIGKLQTCFEDVVLANGLNSFVIESLPTVGTRPIRETARLKRIVDAAENVVLFVTEEDSFAQLLVNRNLGSMSAMILERRCDDLQERFVVIADERFSAVLASTASPHDPSNRESALAVWTFEPEVVYSALKYLMTRMTEEHPFHAATFADAMRLSMPKATSLELTLGVTTKLVRLLQEQAERETALNRIATAIRNTQDLSALLRTVANEVGRALNAKCCAVQVEGELVGSTKTESFMSSEAIVSDEKEDELERDIEFAKVSLREIPKPWVIDGDAALDNGGVAQASVPLLYEGSYVGLLLVQADASRVWGDELLLLHTVADQLTVAVNQAHLIAQLQVQALSDGLTGCYNRRAFEMQLERDLHLATRMRQPLSLIMLDADNFKRINDHGGHETGDWALRIMADCLREELRAVDSAARFGGDEFAVILPQADIEGALIVAERLRKRIAETEIPGYGFMTASFGLATFPVHACSRDTLVVTADRALYESKAGGRNQVSLPPDESHGTFNDVAPLLELEIPMEVLRT